MVNLARHDSLRRALLFALLSNCVGCSADAVSEPEPTLDTAGVFVVTGPVAGSYTLFRVLLTLNFANQQSILFVFRYIDIPKSVAEARALAQRSSLQHTPLETYPRESFVANGYEVVWFRTLTDEERDAVR